MKKINLKDELADLKELWIGKCYHCNSWGLRRYCECGTYNYPGVIFDIWRIALKKKIEGGMSMNDRYLIIEFFCLAKAMILHRGMHKLFWKAMRSKSKEQYARRWDKYKKLSDRWSKVKSSWKHGILSTF